MKAESDFKGVESGEGGSRERGGAAVALATPCKRLASVFNSEREGQNSEFGRVRCREVATEVLAPRDGQSFTWVHLVPNRHEVLDMDLTPLPDLSARNEEPRFLKQVFDDAGVAEMRENFRAGDKMLVDFEHSDMSHDPASSTEAAGWMTDVRLAADGLEVKIEWTPTGRKKIEGKEYRFISPVLLGEWENLTGGLSAEDPVIFRPTILVEAGLTNRPRLRGALRPISNRNNPGGTPGLPERISGDGPGKTKNENMKLKEVVAKAIGVDASLSDDDFGTKVQEHGSELTKLRNKAARVDELEKTVASLQGEQMTADLERFKDVIGDDTETAKTLLVANREAAVKSFEAQQARLAKSQGEATPPHSKVHNKSTAKAPDFSGKEIADDARTAQVANRAAKIASEQNLSLSEAQRQAEAEIA